MQRREKNEATLGYRMPKTHQAPVAARCALRKSKQARGRPLKMCTLPCLPQTLPNTPPRRLLVDALEVEQVGTSDHEFLCSNSETSTGSKFWGPPSASVSYRSGGGSAQLGPSVQDSPGVEAAESKNYKRIFKTQTDSELYPYAGKEAGKKKKILQPIGDRTPML